MASRVSDKVAKRGTLIFGNTLVSLKHSVGSYKGTLYANNQLNTCSHFDTILACDRQTDTQMHHACTDRHALIHAYGSTRKHDIQLSFLYKSTCTQVSFTKFMTVCHRHKCLVTFSLIRYVNMFSFNVLYIRLWSPESEKKSEKSCILCSLNRQTARDYHFASKRLVRRRRNAVWRRKRVRMVYSGLSVVHGGVSVSGIDTNHAISLFWRYFVHLPGLVYIEYQPVVIVRLGLGQVLRLGLALGLSLINMCIRKWWTTSHVLGSG